MKLLIIIALLVAIGVIIKKVCEQKEREKEQKIKNLLQGQIFSPIIQYTGDSIIQALETSKKPIYALAPSSTHFRYRNDGKYITPEIITSPNLIAIIGVSYTKKSFTVNVANMDSLYTYESKTFDIRHTLLAMDNKYSIHAYFDQQVNDYLQKKDRFITVSTPMNDNVLKEVFNRENIIFASLVEYDL